MCLAVQEGHDSGSADPIRSSSEKLCLCCIGLHAFTLYATHLHTYWTDIVFLILEKKKPTKLEDCGWYWGDIKR